MATLFFEGFDKGIIFNQLDPNYWSTQFKRYPKYSFGGYLATEGNPPNTAQVRTYVYNSPNSGLLPSAGYVNVQEVGDNSYPRFGSPPGFLAFSNIEVENTNSVEIPTYLQCSGFPLPSGNTTYLAMRCLGLESKHTGYSDYPNRHILFSYNSGNFPQLTINVVKVTGTDKLIPINGKYETLALEVQQNDTILGYFDLNIANSIPNFRIASIYNSNNTILTTAHTNSSRGYSSIMSRWTHLEFSIDGSQDTPTLFVNAEDINLPVINFDNEIDREDWAMGLPISGFEFNNLRFYNRTYSSSIINTVTDFGHFGQINQQVGQSFYYMFGKNWLLDDLVLIDNSGEDPKYWLGSTARVSQLIPGGGNLDDDGWVADGLKSWSTNSSSHRRALFYLDNDTNSIEAINSGAIDAVAFLPRTQYFNPSNIDTNSAWRESLNEAVGGIKIYNSARKKFLDTKFVNVFRSGVGDPLENDVSLLLHGDSFPIVDSIKTPKVITNNNVMVKGDVIKFNDGSLYFNDSSSYLSINHGDFANSPFTIECWIYFTSHDQTISLFNRSREPLCFDAIDEFIVGPPSDGIGVYYNFSASTTGVTFNRSSNCDKTLLFPSGAQTGVWNHLAVVRTSGNALKCFLNGVANTGYIISDCYNRPCPDWENPKMQIEAQGVFRGTYSINFLNNTRISVQTPRPGPQFIGVTDMKIGLPKKLTTTDEYFNDVSLLIKADRPSVIDLSSNPKNITNSGVVFSNNTSRYGYQSLYFTGGKTLSFANSDDFNFGSDDFSIEFWFLVNNLNADNSYNIFSSNNLNMVLKTGGRPGDAEGNQPWIQVWTKDSNNSSYVLKTPEGQYGMGRYAGSQRTFPFILGAWYYVCITKFAGDLFAYIVPKENTYSGFWGWPLHVLKGEAVRNLSFDSFNTYNNFSMNLNPIIIGDTNSSLSHNLYIDSIRITKGVARINQRLNAVVSAPKEPFGISLPDENITNSVYIDEYRITYGARYDKNFTPFAQPFKSERDDYFPVSPEYNVNKVSYKTFQHYALKNPATNQNWTLPEISGIKLGVKKL